MSRTDRHGPWRVRWNDPYEQRFSWFDQGGKWGWTKSYWFRNCTCRQWYCSAAEPNRHERRASRHDAKRRCREARKGDYQACE